MGIFSKAKNDIKLPWVNLEEEEKLDELIQSSYEKPVLLFKHSTRCIVSKMAKKRLENEWNIDENNITAVYIDLLQYRNISNLIAQKTGVEHQSPQAILLRNGAVVYHSSHQSIDALDIKKLVE